MYSALIYGVRVVEYSTYELVSSSPTNQLISRTEPDLAALRAHELLLYFLRSG